MGSFPLKKKIKMVLKINFKRSMLYCRQPLTPWSRHWLGHLWWQGCTWVKLY